ncbi:hypothetical protein [Nonomuraea typhae]|uniref:hypothetical protein n=1 Tax=Nonomuraea typhae TaxID=2603600 RepID=UPI0012FBA376|nr:hypothetical protein [Nonomuraea typhae]
MADDDLRAILAQAHRDVMDYVEAHTSDEDLLDALPDPAPCPPPVHLVEAVVQARMRLRGIARELVRAELHAQAAATTLGDKRARTLHRAVLAAHDAAAKDLAGLPGLNRALTVALAQALARLVRLHSPEDAPRNEIVAENLGCVVEALAQAIGDAGELAGELARVNDLEGVDASGVDLSGLNVPSVELLRGILWDNRTIWPPKVTALVRACSEEVRAGVFRVEA